jgi:hypothetical protein
VNPLTDIRVPSVPVVTDPANIMPGTLYVDPWPTPTLAAGPSGAGCLAWTWTVTLSAVGGDYGHACAWLRGVWPEVWNAVLEAGGQIVSATATMTTANDDATANLAYQMELVTWSA